MYSVRRRSTRRRSRGFSLLEALAAATVLASGLLLLCGSTISLTRQGKSADSTSVAHALVQEQLERLRSMGLGAAQLAPGSYTDPANPLRADGTNGGQFTRTWTISGNNVPANGLKTVTVRVSWKDWHPHTTSAAGFVRCPNVPC